MMIFMKVNSLAKTEFSVKNSTTNSIESMNLPLTNMPKPKIINSEFITPPLTDHVNVQIIV